MPRINPAAPAVTGTVYRITARFRCEGQLCEWSQDYMGISTETTMGDDAASLLLAFDANCTAAVLAVTSVDTRVEDYLCQCVTSATVASQFHTVDTTGVETSHPLPNNVAPLLKKVSPLKGQHGLGRMYMVAMPFAFYSPSVSPNTLNAVGTAAYRALGAALLLSLVGASLIIYKPVISTRNPVTPFLISNAVIVNHFEAVSIFGEQRRRRVGVGV